MIKAENIKVGYEDRTIIDNLSISIQKGEVVSIIGPNGSGKSTLLKSLSRMLEASEGKIFIMDNELNSMKSNEVARILSMLSQQNSSPSDLTVKDLVYYGRIPHKKWYEPRKKEDEEIVNWAIENTGLSEYTERKVTNLSGGERQRVWLAMALAQQPKILFLDEPTTYLDMCHQLELMELVQEINNKFNMTIVMVLHDLNQAARYSSRIIIMKDGAVVADGKPEEVLCKDIIRGVYNVKCCITKDPINNKPQIFPLEVCYKNKKGCNCCAI